MAMPAKEPSTGSATQIVSIAVVGNAAPTVQPMPAAGNGARRNRGRHPEAAESGTQLVPISANAKKKGLDLST